jgi:hypothetical protein
MREGKTAFILITLSLVLVIFSGCFLFKKKNRCGDCPSWSKKKGSSELPLSSSKITPENTLF